MTLIFITSFFKHRLQARWQLFLLVWAFVAGPPLFAQTRLGLHYTQEELTAWRIRSGQTNYTGTKMYNTTGDVPQGGYAAKAAGNYSPADWGKISNRATSFSTNKSADRYTNYYKGPITTAFPRNDSYESTKGSLLRDAAFHALVTNNATEAATVKAELLSIIDETYTENITGGNTVRAFNFGDTDPSHLRWKPNAFKDLNPGFGIAEWLKRLLYGYDYIKGFFAAAQYANDRNKIETWFEQAAIFMATNYDLDAAALFVNRATGNYSIAPGLPSYLENDANDAEPMYMDASGILHKTRYVSRFYSNRRASMADFVGQVGIMKGNTTLINSAKVFFSELIMFGVYPSGYYVDFLRGYNVEPGVNFAEKGYRYAALPALYTFADALARYGDTSLYDYSKPDGTTASIPGTDASSNNSTNKNIPLMITAMNNLRNQQAFAYTTTDPAQKNATYQMDGHDATKTSGPYNEVNDIIYAVPNLYYRNNAVLQSYNREHPNSEPYENYPIGFGTFEGWNIGHYPGTLFMFGKMEKDPANPFLSQYEAEDAVVSGGANVTANVSGYSGTGFVDRFGSSNPSPAVPAVSFTVNVPVSGNYTISLRYANAQATARTLSLYVKHMNSPNPTKLRQISLPVTGTVWTAWGNKLETVTLAAGVSTITYQRDNPSDNGGINIDYIIRPVLAGGSRIAISEESIQKAILHLTAYPNPSAHKMTVEFTTNQTDPVKLKLYNTQGVIVGEWFEEVSEAGKVQQVEINTNQFTQGLYILGLITPQRTIHQKVIFKQ